MSLPGAKKGRFEGMNGFRVRGRLRATCFLLVSVLSLPSILSSESIAAEESVVLGYQGPLTGEEAEVGISQLHGVKYAIDVFNQKFNGRIKVTLKELDDKGDPAKAGPVAEFAARDNNLLGIVGPAYSGATIASLVFYKPAGIPLISPSATRLSLTDPEQGSMGFPVFHRLALTDKTQGPALYKIATAGVASPKVFVVDDQSAYGVGLVNYMKPSIPAGQSAGFDSVSDKTTDWSATISKIKTAGANVVIYTGYFPQAAPFFKQLRDSGYKGILAGGDGVLSPTFATLAPASVLDGVRITSPTLPVGYISPWLDMEFRRKFGSEPGVYSFESLEAANILLFCIAKGSRTRSQMLSCIDGYSGPSLTGRVLSFDSFGDIRNPEWYEFWAQKDAIGTFPFTLMSKVNRYSDLASTHDAFPWAGLALNATAKPTPTATPDASQAPSTSCSSANSVGTASLSRVSDLVVQVDAIITACSYEIVVVSDTGEIFRTGVININQTGQVNVREEFINASCATGYSFYTNAWTLQNGRGNLNRTPSNRMLSATCAPSSIVKPSTPTFSGVNFVGNKIDINVNLGSSTSSRPDKVYLVAPKLGVNSSTPLEGKISGSTASWSLPLNSILSGVAIPLEIVGEKNGVRSEPLTGSYTKPAVSITAVPPAPSNYASRIVGSSAIVSIQVSAKENSRAASAHLYSSALGIKKNPGLQGDVLGNKALIEIPIKASMAGKKYPLTIYLKNSKGESKPLNATLTIPRAPKAPTVPTVLPKPSVPKAVICSFGNQTRTFEDDCPPGWEKR